MANKRLVGGNEVRAWAQENGHPVGTRGRFSAELIEAFEKAHKRRVKYAVGHVEPVELRGTRVTEKGRKIPVKVKATLPEVRAWARENGHEVGERGRLPAEVLTAFASAAR